MALTIDGSDPSGDLGDLLDAKRDASLPVGKILQVVSAVKTDTTAVSTSSYTFTSDILTVSITPSSATSKIFLTGAVNGSISLPGASAVYRLLRSSTPIGIGDAAGSRAVVTGSGASGASNDNTFHAPISYLDSPATTSAITYAFQFYNYSSITRTLYVNRADGDADNGNSRRSISTIIAMEVSA